MIERSLSARIDKGDLNHNNRSVVTENVRQDRIQNDIIVCRKSLKQLYHNLFDEALQEYNDRLTRKDRRIPNYREHIRHSRQEKEFHEVLFQIGNMSDTGVDSDSGKVSAAILEEFAKSFEKRNPHLKVFNAVIHLDEETPHLHLDFVPVTDEVRKNGMRVRNSLTGALRQQGFSGTGKGHTITMDWLEHEKEILGQIMLAHGIRWVNLDTHENHLSVTQFKAKKKQEELEQATAALDDVQQELEKASKKKTKLTEIDSIETGKTIFGGKVTVGKEDFENISALAKKQVASEKQTKKLKAEKAELLQKVAVLEQQVRQMSAELEEYRKPATFSLDKFKQEAKKKSELEQLRIKYKKAITFIETCGLKSDYEQFRPNNQTRKNTLE